jgi:hypothetical protein
MKQPAAEPMAADPGGVHDGFQDIASRTWPSTSTPANVLTGVIRQILMALVHSAGAFNEFHQDWLMAAEIPYLAR